MEYEIRFHGNSRLVAANPALPIEFGNYTNITAITDGPPIAHAVAAGSSRPECGAEVRVLPHGFPWSHPIPDWWNRCTKCVALHPI
ncbi:hypothetical protein ACFXHA_18255 [Nocardia sp. NPDC059240]|uniref:hypothetical protein n=1 Tax=Nocardia sp. NPDC059240 TaxID=3346786 RepID=UPI003685D480